LISERESSGSDVRSALAQIPEHAGQGIGINHHQINAQVIGEALHELILKSSGAGVVAVERGRTRAGDDSQFSTFANFFKCIRWLAAS
jgi:hypothetical protein